MEMQELTIKRREATGKAVAKRLRRAGEVPAILYGGAKPEPVLVDPKAVLKMIHGREGTTQLLTLKFDGEAGGGRRMAIIRDLQFDPVTEHLLHVDLQEVSGDRTITVRVAVRPVGEPAGVKEQKGILNIVVHELEVSCLPTAIPERIDADVSALMIGDVLTVAQLQAPQGVRILTQPGQAVATVVPPMAEEAPVAAAPTAAVVTEPEVLTERKPKEVGAPAPEEGKKPKKPEKAEKEKERIRTRVAHAVVGLGNPGAEYRDTRHNVRQRGLDLLGQMLKRPWHREGQALTAHGQWRGRAGHPREPPAVLERGRARRPPPPRHHRR